MGNTCCSSDETTKNVDASKIFDLDQLHPLNHDEYDSERSQKMKIQIMKMYKAEQEIFIGSELRCVFSCSPSEAMEIVPRQIRPVKLIEDPDMVGVMQEYEDHEYVDWAQPGCKCIYSLADDQKLIENWTQIDYDKRHFTYNYLPKDLDPEAEKFLEIIEGTMWFKDMSHDPYSSSFGSNTIFVWQYKFIPKPGYQNYVKTLQYARDHEGMINNSVLNMEYLVNNFIKQTKPKQSEQDSIGFDKYLGHTFNSEPEAEKNTESLLSLNTYVSGYKTNDHLEHINQQEQFNSNFQTQTVFNREIKDEFKDELYQIEKGTRSHWLNQKDGNLAYILCLHHKNEQILEQFVNEILQIDDNFKSYEDENGKKLIYMPLSHIISETFTTENLRNFQKLAKNMKKEDGPELSKSIIQFINFAQLHYDVVDQFGILTQRFSMLHTETDQINQEF